MLEAPFDNVKELHSLLKQPNAFTPKGLENLGPARSGVDAATARLQEWNSVDYIPTENEVLAGYTPGMFDDHIQKLYNTKGSFSSIDTNVLGVGVPKNVVPGQPGSLNINRIPQNLSIAKAHKTSKEILDNDDSCVSLSDIVGNVLGGLGDYLSDITDAIGDVMTEIGQGLEYVLNSAMSVIEPLIDSISDAATAITDAITEELQKFGQMLDELFDFSNTMSFPSLGLDPCTATVLKEVAGVGLLGAGAYAATKIAGKGTNFLK